MRFLAKLEYKYRTFKEQVGALIEFNFFKVARQADRSFLLQVWEAIWGWLRYGLLPISYYNYSMYEDKAPLSKKVKAYVSDRSHFSKLGQVNQRHHLILSNKWVFHNYFDNYPIPLPKCWGYLHQYGGIWSETGTSFDFAELPEIFSRMNGHRVVLKPIYGSSGSRIAVADVICDGDCHLRIAGAMIPLAEWALNLKKGDYIIVECLTQHQVLKEIYPHAVNTVRINTLNDSQTVKFWGTNIKLGSGNAQVDNWAQGGIGVGIDMQTGKMLTGKYNIGWSQKIYPPFSAHPDTHVQFEGVTLPYWQELQEVVVNAAKLVPMLPYIAWDVAITPTGPCIIEGNSRSNLSMVQVHGGLMSEETKEWWRQFGIKI